MYLHCQKFNIVIYPVFCSQVIETMEQKKRVVISYKNCPPEVLQAIKEKYPAGYGDAIIKVQKPNGDIFHAITLDFDNISYLVKVDVKIDNLTEEEFEKQFGGASDADDSGSDYGKDDENPDNIASSDNSYEE